MSYELRRLRLYGPIERQLHSNTYVLTDEGIRVAVFNTKLQNRLLRTLPDADKPPANTEIRHALATLGSCRQRLHRKREARPAR